MLSLCLSIWIGIGGCSKKEEANNNVEALANLFLDLATATEQYQADTTALRQKQEALLQAHHISPTEVEQALEKYNQHPEKWIQILQRMSEKQKEDKKVGKQKAAQ